MNKKRYFGGLLLLFFMSCMGILVGYYDGSLGLRESMQIAFDEVPFLAVAFGLTLSCPVSMILAFRSSPNDFDSFTMELYAISCLASFGIVIIAVPSEVSHPYYIDDSLWLTWVILVVAQMAACQVLRGDFWRMARREK